MKLVKLCLSLLILVFVSSVIHAEEDSQLNEAATLEKKAVILKKAAIYKREQDSKIKKKRSKRAYPQD